MTVCLGGERSTSPPRVLMPQSPLITPRTSMPERVATSPPHPRVAAPPCVAVHSQMPTTASTARKSLPSSPPYMYRATPGDQSPPAAAPGKLAMSPRNSMPSRSQYQHRESGGGGGSFMVPMQPVSSYTPGVPRARAISPGTTGAVTPRTSMRPAHVRQQSPREAPRQQSPHERAQVRMPSTGRGVSPSQPRSVPCGLPDLSANVAAGVSAILGNPGNRSRVTSMDMSMNAAKVSQRATSMDLSARAGNHDSFYRTRSPESARGAPCMVSIPSSILPMGPSQTSTNLRTTTGGANAIHVHDVQTVGQALPLKRTWR